MTKFISLTIMNLGTPKARAKHEFLFNKQDLDVGLLNIQV